MTDTTMDAHLGYTVAEAWAVAGIGRSSLYKAIRSGQLRAVKCGKRTLLLPGDLRRWLEGLPPLSAESPSAPSAIVRGGSGLLPPPSNRKLASGQNQGNAGHFAA
jgi:excisionase family DNA binding protein